MEKKVFYHLNFKNEYQWELLFNSMIPKWVTKNLH